MNANGKKSKPRRQDIITSDRQFETLQFLEQCIKDRRPISIKLLAEHFELNYRTIERMLKRLVDKGHIRLERKLVVRILRRSTSIR